MSIYWTEFQLHLSPPFSVDAAHICRDRWQLNTNAARSGLQVAIHLGPKVDFVSVYVFTDAASLLADIQILLSQAGGGNCRFISTNGNRMVNSLAQYGLICKDDYV